MKKVKRILLPALLLVFIFGMSSGTLTASGEIDPAAEAPDQDAVVTDKDEVVYARLAGDGEARDVYAVNHFTLESAGRLSDYGQYASVTNLTDLQPLDLGDGVVEIRTAGENFYYQGTLEDKALPWRYSIRYSLDGAEIVPGDLAGRSGRLEIRLTSSPNKEVDETFYNNYMQQISVALDTGKCFNIKADGATAANAGMNRLLNFTVLPENDADITVSADVRDFEMAGIDITAMPFSVKFDLPDISGLLDGFTELSDAVAELDKGVGQLKDAAAELKSGSAGLAAGSSDFKGGLAAAGAGAPGLTEASAQIKAALEQLAPLSKELTALSQNYAEFHSGLLTYTKGVAALPGSYAELDAGVAGLSEGISELQGGLSELHEGTGKLADETAELPEQLQTELDKLISEYTGGSFDAVSFISGKNEKISFVQFVFKTENIEKPGADDTSAAEDKKESFWERLTGLFGKS